MSTISISDKFKQEWSLAGLCPFFGEFDTTVYGENVHSVHLKTGDKVSSGVVLGVARRSLGRGSHSIQVVFADKDGGLQVQEKDIMALSACIRIGTGKIV